MLTPPACHPIAWPRAPAPYPRVPNPASFLTPLPHTVLWPSSDTGAPAACGGQ